MRYIKREYLSNLIGFMIKEAKRTKSRISTEHLRPGRDWTSKYWNDYIDRVNNSIEHYCENAGVYIHLNFDERYTIKQLEVIKYILSLRRNNGGNNEIL